MRLKGFALGVVLLFLASTGMALAQGATAGQYVAAGNQFYAAKDYAKAVQYYKYATTLDANSAGAYQGLGNAYYGLGQKADALAAYEKALQLNPNNPQLSSFVQTLRSQVGGTTANAQSTATSSPATGSPKNFELAPTAGVAFATGFTGFGGGADGFFMISPNFGLGGMIHYYTFGYSIAYVDIYETQSYTFGNETETDSLNLSSLEFVAALKYKFGGAGLSPYLLLGIGGAMVGLSATSSFTYDSGPPLFPASSTSASVPSSFFPIVEGGGGLEFSLGKDMSIFVETTANVLLSSFGSGTYIPVQAGLNFGL